MAHSNHIEKIAIVGATGRIGKHFAEALLKTGRHVVTAIIRSDSKRTVPDGVEVAKVNYDDEQSLISALKGQQFLVITLAARGVPQDLHNRIVQAAAKAGVPYIMPNAFGSDIFNEELMTASPLGTDYKDKCEQVTTVGCSFIVMCCGFWYEWSLGLPEPWFGFDIKDRSVTFFDDGNTKINTSTWQQCGRALAELLSLPQDGASPAVADWKNKALYISSFKVSQRDMLDSIHRVIGTTDKDWKITYEPTDTRVKRGYEELKSGNMMGFARVLYSRTFFPDGSGDYESTRGLANSTLGLPEEELDEATMRTIDMVESGWNPFTE